MKMKTICAKKTFCFTLIFGLAINCIGATHYVSTNGAGQSPYTNWANAATNLQDAVNVARTNAAPRTVWVSNGTYYLANQVTVDSTVTVASVNGRDVTIVDGNYPNVTNRCFNLSKEAILDGFTVRNGCALSSGGGGIYGNNAGTRVQNCRIIANIATNQGVWGGGVCLNYASISNCEVFGNTGTGEGGGGIYVYSTAATTALVSNCIIASNMVTGTNSSREIRGGGIYADGNGVVIKDCIIYANSNYTAGYTYCYGGGVTLAGNALLRDSIVYGNYARYGGGIYQYVISCRIQNSTVVSNSCATSGGGIYLNNPTLSTAYLENVISYFNTGSSSSNIAFTVSNTGVFYIVNSCIAPTNGFPTSGVVGFFYANNIQSDPQFIGKDSNDFHLSRNSPCINAGTNQDWMNGALDLGGHSRIDRFSGIVDMGCYEYLPQGTMYSVP